MRIVRTLSSGELTRSEKYHFGGSYSFFEKLFNGGVGSNKLIYEEGIHEIDYLKRNIEGEIVFVNFELLPNGLIIRANCNQRKVVLGVKISDIKSIVLMAKRLTDETVLTEYKNLQIEFEGEISIHQLFTDKISKFLVTGSEFKDLVKFFQARQLDGRLKYKTLK